MPYVIREFHSFRKVENQLFLNKIDQQLFWTGKLPKSSNVGSEGTAAL